MECQSLSSWSLHLLSFLSLLGEFFARGVLPDGEEKLRVKLVTRKADMKKNGVRSHIPTFQHSNLAVCLRRAKSNSHGTKAPLQLPPA